MVSLLSLIARFSFAKTVALTLKAWRTDDVRPRILVMDDCSGSTFVQHAAIELLQRHGYEIYFPDDYEILKPGKNWAYQANPSKGMGHAMEKMCKKAESNKGVLVFKGEPKKMQRELDVVSVMTSRNALVVHVYRSNVLDQAVCRVRDCFDTRVGKAVDEHGDKSQLCFDRRFSESQDKATFNITRLVQWIDDKMHLQRTIQVMLRGWGFRRPGALAYEELSAFQYDTPIGEVFPYSCDFLCSLRAWCKLLNSWDIEPNPALVKDYLVEIKQTEGVHTAPSNHSDVIYNFAEVKNGLQKAGTPYNQFVRG